MQMLILLLMLIYKKMNRIKNITLLLIIFILSANAQEKVKVISSVSQNNNEIIVKWYSKTVFTGKAVNIYRADANSENWSKLNSTPIKKKPQIPQSLLAKDEAFNAIANSVSGKPEDLNGFLILIVMIKSVEYPEFADFLGIQYLDKTAVKGKSYKYKITDTNGKTFGISDKLDYKTFEKLNAPDSCKIDIKEHIPLIKWKPNENIFFGYYVYRSNKKGKEKTRITKQAIIIAKNDKGKYPEYNFNDDTMNIGEVYYYNIVGIDYFGQESKISKELIAVIRDEVPPTAPASVNANVIGVNVNLFWESPVIADLAGFNVYRSKTKKEGFVKINKELIDKNYRSFNDEVEDVGVQYYKVSSIDTAGNEAYSYVRPVDITDVFPPETPKNVICTADTGIINIFWKDNEESDLMGYYVFRTISKTDNNNYALINSDPIKENKYSDTLPKLARNKFYYKIVAVDTSYNRSGYSDFAVIGMPDITPPKKPIIKSVTAQEDKLIVEWFQNFETDLAGYNIYRKAKNDTINKAEQLNIGTISKNTFVFTDIFAKKDIRYEYTIVAFDTSGNKSEISDAYFAVLLDKSRNEQEFSNFKASYSKNKKQVKLTWKIKNVNNIKGYMVYRKEGSKGQIKPLTGLINDVEYIDKKINTKKQGTYSYQVRVFTNSGLIIKSEIKNIEIVVD